MRAIYISHMYANTYKFEVFIHQYINNLNTYFVCLIFAMRTYTHTCTLYYHFS